MKIDLDDLERKANAAVGGEWKVNDPAVVVCDGNDDDIADASGQGWSPKQERENAAHIAANSPPVTLAMIARIRELEALAGDLLVEYVRGSDVDRLPGAAQYALLEKGVVLP